MRKRQIVLGALAVLVAAVAAYGLQHVTPIKSAIAGILVGLTAVLMLAADSRDPQKDGIRTMRAIPTAIAVFVTGLLMTLVLYAAILTVTPLTYFFSRSHVTVQVLWELLQRIQILDGLLHPPLIIGYIAGAFLTAVTIWALRPFVPIQRQEYAGMATFAVVGLYAILLQQLVVPAFYPVMMPIQIAVDAALLLIAAALFGSTYRYVDQHTD